MCGNLEHLKYQAKSLFLKQTIALSKILYTATMKVPSKLILGELDLIQKEFIWDSKRPKKKLDSYRRLFRGRI